MRGHISLISSSYCIDNKDNEFIENRVDKRSAIEEKFSPEKNKS